MAGSVSARARSAVYTTAETVVPKLRAEVGSERAQARSQALHTLSKIGDKSAPATAGATASGSAWRNLSGV